MLQNCSNSEGFPVFEAVIRPGVVLRCFLPCRQKKRCTVVDDSCFDPEVSPQQTCMLGKFPEC